MSFRYLFSFYRVTSKCILYRKLAETPRDHELRFSLSISPCPSLRPFLSLCFSRSLSFSFLISQPCAVRNFVLTFNLFYPLRFERVLFPSNETSREDVACTRGSSFSPSFLFCFFFIAYYLLLPRFCLEIDFRRVPLEELATFFFIFFLFCFLTKTKKQFLQIIRYLFCSAAQTNLCATAVRISELLNQLN